MNTFLKSFTALCAGTLLAVSAVVPASAEEVDTAFATEEEYSRAEALVPDTGEAAPRAVDSALGVEAASPGFYDWADTNGAAGTISHSEPVAFASGAQKALGSYLGKSTKVMYRSTNHRGEIIGVSGTLFESTATWSREERPTMVLAPGTKGLGDKCAPSVGLEQGSSSDASTVVALLRAGYNVMVTDYYGSGTTFARHSYLNRVDQGNAVLDAARAVQALGVVSKDAPFGIWGFSQGGGAAASAGELHSEYAPELNIKGIYAGAAPADLQAVLNKLDGTLYNALELMGVAGLSGSYGIDMSQYFSIRGMEALEHLQSACLMDALRTYSSITSTNGFTRSGLGIAEMMQNEQIFHEIIAENNLGQQGRHPRVPTLIASSWGDDVIPHQSNRELAARYCEAGTRVSFYTAMTPTHGLSGYTIIPRALIFFDRQFKDLPNANDCWQVGA